MDALLPSAMEGAKLYKNLISPNLSQKIFDRIDDLEWSNVISRAVQHYWYRYSYSGDKTLTKAPNPPEFLLCITKLLHKKGILKVMPNQIIINKYEPGQGISAHIDDPRLFGDEVATLSLGSDVIMTFRRGSEKIDLDLPVGSIFVMTGEARYSWTHEIAKRKTDAIDGEKRSRKTRMSITWRTVK